MGDEQTAVTTLLILLVAIVGNLMLYLNAHFCLALAYFSKPL
ncbi:hypothetical protein yfred0001_30010 [Yersinia frederiksenii ATCC 33641]|nr:hypothetical protein yfred0001_30010 [Yersinia frederiksenii ATCC 33641]